MSNRAIAPLPLLCKKKHKESTTWQKCHAKPFLLSKRSTS